MKNVFSTFLNLLVVVFSLFFSIALPVEAHAQAPISDRDVPSCTLEMTIEGPITPGTYDFLSRGLAQAQEQKCRSILLNINTPGGALPTTRKIVEMILASPVPFLCLVSPSGGHAGSAGAIILYSCHVSGAEPATNIGAATPVSATGEAIAEDMRKKLIQDTVSWVKGLAKLRGRNQDLAEKIVTEARSLDADEAVKENVIDKMALDKKSFLDFAEGREVVMAAGVSAFVQTGALTVYQADLRYEFLQFITNPQWAYVIFMLSLALLYFEITTPGGVIPGILGGFGLIVSLIAFHGLNVWWGGAAMIALGIGLLIAEAFVPSFGALGIGGLLILAAGSLLLYDPNLTGNVLPLSLVIGTIATIAIAMLGIGFVALKTRRKGGAIAEVALLSAKGRVVSLELPSHRRGMIEVKGELWRFVSEKDLNPGDLVEVIEQKQLTLTVKPAQSGEV